MICDNCLTTIPDDTVVCPVCGSKLGEASDEPKESEAREMVPKAEVETKADPDVELANDLLAEGVGEQAEAPIRIEDILESDKAPVRPVNREKEKLDPKYLIAFIVTVLVLIVMLFMFLLK
ncbi:hypothetical protein [Butyrivibrio sp. VCB2006]|uniref:hypothetical protein n=1 Tax=Butyrivibrio sp. VCB2006 TaxID=1280679 RepID=UPI0004003788|nr:hypothetical protein [Butyrivibrio sp. VCB2006]